MPSQSTLTGPFGPPVRRRRPYSRAEEEREIYAGTSRIGRIVPIVVAAIGAAVIVGSAALYSAGVVGAPTLRETPELPMKEPRFEPNPAFSQALAVQALRNLDRHATAGRGGSARATPSPGAGSLTPPERMPRAPGATVTPPAPGQDETNSEAWEPPVAPKPPEGTEDLPRPADPESAPPSGYAD